MVKVLNCFFYLHSAYRPWEYDDAVKGMWSDCFLNALPVLLLPHNIPLQLGINFNRSTFENCEILNPFFFDWPSVCQPWQRDAAVKGMLKQWYSKTHSFFSSFLFANRSRFRSEYSRKCGMLIDLFIDTRRADHGSVRTMAMKSADDSACQPWEGDNAVQSMVSARSLLQQRFFYQLSLWFPHNSTIRITTRITICSTSLYR